MCKCLVQNGALKGLPTAPVLPSALLQNSVAEIFSASCPRTFWLRETTWTKVADSDFRHSKPQETAFWEISPGKSPSIQTNHVICEPTRSRAVTGVSPEESVSAPACGPCSGRINVRVVRNPPGIRKFRLFGAPDAFGE